MTNNKIITLSNFLRKEGMVISIRSTITASWLWENYNKKLTPDELKESLKCIYVKNKEDFSKFDNVYDQLFNNTSQSNTKNNYKNSNKSRYEVDGQKNIDINTTPEYHENLKLIEERRENKIINDNLTHDSLIMLDNFDNRIFDICQRLSKKIANQRNKRRKRQKSNNINMPHTIRYNLKNGGHLIKLINQKPQIKKTKQIFLCDISGSCQWISTWFFAILYGCYQTFDKVTIYDFDNKIVDVTNTLKKEFSNTNQINFAHQELGVKPFGQSAMTNSFKEFLNKANLNNNTDVIILTDCRDWKGKRENGVIESAIILRQIVQKSRRVIILNPEKKIRWNTPTSCVSEYENAGAIIYETGTLDQFAKVISKL